MKSTKHKMVELGLIDKKSEQTKKRDIVSNAYRAEFTLLTQMAKIQLQPIKVDKLSWLRRRLCRQLNLHSRQLGRVSVYCANRPHIQGYTHGQTCSWAFKVRYLSRPSELRKQHPCISCEGVESSNRLKQGVSSPSYVQRYVQRFSLINSHGHGEKCSILTPRSILNKPGPQTE